MRSVVATRAGWVVMVIALAGGLAASLSEAQSGRPMVRLVFARPTAAITFIALDVAIAKGLFKEEGVDLDVVNTQGGPKAIAAILSGNAHVGSIGYPVLVPALQKDLPVQVVGGIGVANTTVLVVSKAVATRTGVSVQMPLDNRIRALSGLKIGMLLGSASETTTRLLLKRVNLDPAKDVELVNLQSTPIAALAALRSGAVDGFVEDVITAAMAEVQGVGLPLISMIAGDLPEERGMLFVALVARKAYATEHPEQMVAVNRAIYRSLRFLREHPDQVAVTIRDCCYKNVDVDVLKRAVALMGPAHPATPVVSQRSVEIANSFVSTLRGQPITLPFERVVDNRFASQAVTEVDRR